MWALETKSMCRKHLLGEHLECHMFLGAICQEKKLEGFVRKGLLVIEKLAERHNLLAEEMGRRGYKHNTPFQDYLIGLDYYTLYGGATLTPQDVLLNRCSECKKLYDNNHKRKS
jgi:hypothetical protein